MAYLTRIFGVILAAGALLGISAVSVQAVDLTGTYEGKITCKGFDGSKVKKVFPSFLEITQTGSNLNILSFSFGPFNGTVIEDDKKPDEKGQAGFISCFSDPLAPEGEVGSAKVTDKSNAVTFYVSLVTDVSH